MFSLDGKVAFVTGGNGGIGLGMAKGFIEHGASVVLAARTESKLESAVAEIVAMDAADRVLAVRCDVTDRDSVQSALDATVEKFGGVDIVVNNAGTNRRADEPHLLSDEDWRFVIDTNLTGMHNVTSLAFPLMKSRGGGKFINVGSMMSIFGSPYASAYAASKGGVVQYTKSCAVAWAKYNVQVNAILPGVASLIDRGFVDKDRVGTQGHSWGGYQTAFLVTRTDMFAAAESGAPVSNMTSAYGGIRWSSGRSRMFQYEKTQSRIGGSLWEAQTQYFENSPIFRADKINTPLLILHNDKDGAVPWYQGIELFVAMRRLGRPAWLFNYNGEAHGLRQKHNRKDWTIRMQQFFDHYLKDAPPPVWLVEGVPAVEKGKNLGLDLIEKDGKKKAPGTGH